MSKLGSDILIVPQDLFKSSTTAQVDLGALSTTGDNRYYRYALAGGTSLVAGTLLQGPAQVANHLQLTPTAAAIGATSVTVTLGATLATANQYANGYLAVSADSGGTPGQLYQISGHPAAALSSSLTLNLYPTDALLVAITASAKIDLILNPYSNVIITPAATATTAPHAVAHWALPTATYGWIQVAGTANILNDAGGSLTVGTSVIPSVSVAGAVKAATGAFPTVGTLMTTMTVSQNGVVKLNLE